MNMKMRVCWVVFACLGLTLLGSGCGKSSDTSRDAGYDGVTDGSNGTRICTSGEDCLDGEECLKGVCRPTGYCEVTEDCTEAYFCNRITHECQEAECLLDEDCGTGFNCVDWVCKSVCDGVECDAGKRCNPETGECEPIPCTVSPQPCARDADCEGNLHCDPVAHGCTECPRGFFCNIHECFALNLECNAHTDCAAGERCNPESHRCEPYPESCETDKECTPKYCNLYTRTCQDDPFTGACRSDEECHRAFGEEYFCHPRLQNCVLPIDQGQCYDTEDCADPGLVCDLKSNTCAERGTVCGVDSDCDANHACMNGVCIFVCPVNCEIDDECAYGDVCRNGCCMEDESCWDDYECTPPKYCIDGWCQEPLPCLGDDGFEDNDDASTAAVLSLPPADQTEDHLGLYVCRRDDDWYAIEVPDGSSLTVRIFFAHGRGDLDMELYDSPGSSWPVDESAGVDDTEEVSATASGDTTFYVKVYGWAGAENSYDMQVEHGDSGGPGPNPCNPDDDYEDNDGWADATVLPLPAFGSPGDEYHDLIMCSEDDDWFAIDVPTNQAVRVTITFQHSLGDLDMALYANPNQGSIDSSTSVWDSEEVEVLRVQADTTFYVKVYGYMGAENTYDLKVEHPQPIVIDCSDSGLEPNNDAASATTKGPGEFPGLFICMGTPQDEDWYRLPVAAGERLKVDIAFDSYDGDLNLVLYEPNGVTEVDRSDDYWADYEQVESPRAQQDTEYLLVVYADSYGLWEDTEYDMRVVIEPPIDCTDGGYEPNDDVAAATELGEGRFPAFFICDTTPTDMDWYSFRVAAGERLNVEIAFDSNDGNLDLYMYEDDGVTEVAVSDDYYADSERVSSNRVAQDTVYMVLVASESLDSDTMYDMTVTLDPPLQCTDDGHEPNDEPDQATELTPTESGPMVMCPANVDYFAVQALRTDRLRFILVNYSGWGDVDLYLYDSWGEELDSSTDAGTGAEHITYDVYQDGVYYAVVVPHDPDADDLVEYNLRLLVETFEVCDQDAYEPNDSTHQPTVITDMQFSQAGSDWTLELLDLQACKPAPADWFAFDLEQDAALDILVRFTDADGDIDIVLYDPNGDEIRRGGSSTDDEAVGFDCQPDCVPETGRYTLKVWLYGSGEGSNTYDLVVTSDRAFP